MADKDKSIRESIEDQKKKYDIRDKDLKKYHTSLIETTNEKDLSKRSEEFLKEKGKIRKITQKKLTDRDYIPYGKKRYSFQLEDTGKGDYYIMRDKNKKIVQKIKRQKGKDKEFHRKIAYKNLEKEKFSYDKYFIPEDLEPSPEYSKTKGNIISYETYFRYGIIIYRLVKGRRYEVLFQTNDAQALGLYLSFQRIIGEIKSDVLNRTNISLEEWIYLSKKTPNLHLEGGLMYKRFKNVRDPDTTFRRKVSVFERHYDFETGSYTDHSGKIVK